MSKKSKSELEDVLPGEEVNETTAPETDQDEAKDLEDSISEEERLREELSLEKDKFLRLFAGFENYKKRTSKERMDLFKTAGQEVIVALLPVLDDFDRAL
ncbi:MAG: nucleotide exchange factor GrpE, partial [Eudoraea sp.]|nr:nucleotide exchange factor GrpE [Eudoraea sp.]